MKKKPTQIRQDGKFGSTPIICLILDDEHAQHMRTAAEEVRGWGNEWIDRQTPINCLCLPACTHTGLRHTVIHIRKCKKQYNSHLHTCHTPQKHHNKQVKARGADLIIITDSPKLARGLVADPIIIPSNGPLTALIATLPLQLLAYELAILKVGWLTYTSLAPARVLGSCLSFFDLYRRRLSNPNPFN